MVSEDTINLWLDDIRPAPIGWIHVKTVEEAKERLKVGNVLNASLDHDLGACAKCMGNKSVLQWLEENHGQSMPHCMHVGTGYDLVCWMEETGYWPILKPIVHSANPAGRQRMKLAIETENRRRGGNWR